MLLKTHGISDECMYNQNTVISFSDKCKPTSDPVPISMYKSMKYSKNNVWFLIHYVIIRHISIQMTGRVRCYIRGGTAFMIKWMEHKHLSSIIEDVLPNDVFLNLPNDFDFIVEVLGDYDSTLQDFEKVVHSTVQDMNCAHNHMDDLSTMKSQLDNMSINSIYKYCVHVTQQYTENGFYATIQKLFYIDNFLMPTLQFSHMYNEFDNIVIKTDFENQQWNKQTNRIKSPCDLKTVPFHMRARKNVRNAYYVEYDILQPKSIFHHYQIIQKLHNISDNSDIYISHVDYTVARNIAPVDYTRLSTHFYTLSIDELLKEQFSYICQDHLFGLSKKTVKLFQRWCMLMWIATARPTSNANQQTKVDKEYTQTYIEHVLSSELIGFLLHASYIFRHHESITKWRHVIEFAKQFQSHAQLEKIRYHMHKNKVIVDSELQQRNVDNVIYNISQTLSFINQLINFVASVDVTMVVNTNEQYHHWLIRFILKDIN